MRARSVRRSISVACALISALVLGACTIERREQPTTEGAGEAAAFPAPEDYIAQPPPDSTARIFASGLVCTGNEERDAAWSPDGREFLYTIGGPRHTILRMRRAADRWTGPEVAPFSGRHDDLEPAFSPDGRRLFFVSNRPRAGDGEDVRGDFDIWVVDRTDGDWGEPRNLGPPVNTDGNEFYPSIASDGTLYFTADRPGGLGGEDIWRARPRTGSAEDTGSIEKTSDAAATGRIENARTLAYAEPENLGDPVNSPAPEFNGCITADGSVLIYTPWGRPGGQGSADLYLSRRGPDGRFGAPAPLTQVVNGPGMDYCPSVTPDGRYLFFSRARGPGNLPSEHLEYDDLLHLLSEPGNGRGDILWVRTEAALPDSGR